MCATIHILHDEHIVRVRHTAKPSLEKGNDKLSCNHPNCEFEGGLAAMIRHQGTVHHHRIVNAEDIDRYATVIGFEAAAS